MKYKGCVLFLNNIKNIPDIGYRPHLSCVNSDYLMGVEFIWFDTIIQCDKYVNCIIKTLYENVDYSLLKVNNIYEVREGKNRVGKLKLLEIIENK